jgi:hypothetical protein
MAKERGWQLDLLTKPRDIMRYTFFLPETDRQRRELFSVEVDNGLIYQRRRPNGGGITVVYDSNTSKAYVNQNSR